MTSRARFRLSLPLGSALVAVLGGVACPRPPIARPRPVRPVSALVPPAPRWPMVKPSNSVRFREALQVFRALYAPEDAAARGKLRQRLATYLLPRLPAALKADYGRRGFKLYTHLIELYRRPLEDGRAEVGALDDEQRGQLVAQSRAVLETFRPRGAAVQSLTALAVLERLDRAHRATWRQRIDVLVRWLIDIEQPLEVGVRLHGDAIQAVEEALEHWPSPTLRAVLRGLYHRQYVFMAPWVLAGGLPVFKRGQEAIAVVRDYPWQLVRLLVLAQDRRGLARLYQGMGGGEHDDPHLRDQLRRVLTASPRGADVVALAESLRARWPDAARRLCLETAQRHPESGAARVCLGRIALSRGHSLEALRRFHEALRVSANHRQAWELFASTYSNRLVSLLGQERLEQVEREVRYLARFFGLARGRWATEPLETSLADIYYLLGRGFFDAGRIDDAAQTLRRAAAMKPLPHAMVKMGEIALWRGQYGKAIRRLRGAFDKLKTNSAWRFYWELRVAPQVAAALAQLVREAERHGHKATALRHRRRLNQVLYRSLTLSRYLLKVVTSKAQRAEILVIAGKLFYRAGSERLALHSFEQALDLAPSRSSTYVDVISFLVMYGYFDAALDAYHRALARENVSEYIKAYCTFWLIDLGRRSKVDPERLGLAEVFLRHLRGSQWYHQIARLLRGKRSHAELLKVAHTKGQRAELDFYWSMMLYRRGQRDKARALWKKIVDSEMIAFFEYKMVRRYLQFGVPNAPVRPVRRRVGR